MRCIRMFIQQAEKGHSVLGLATIILIVLLATISQVHSQVTQFETRTYHGSECQPRPFNPDTRPPLYDISGGIINIDDSFFLPVVCPIVRNHFGSSDRLRVRVFITDASLDTLVACQVFASNRNGSIEKASNTEATDNAFTGDAVLSLFINAEPPVTDRFGSYSLLCNISTQGGAIHSYLVSEVF